MQTNKPVLIFKYTPTCSGIGDFLRGAGYMYNICKETGVEFYLDITNSIHPFFEYPVYSGDTSTFTHVYFRDPTPMEGFVEFINGFPHKHNIILRSNISKIRSPYIVTNLSTLLRPTPAILADVTTHLDQIGLQLHEYSCIHIRYGDKVLRGPDGAWDNRAGDDAELIDRTIAKAFAIRKDCNKPTLIISDNYDAKVAITRQYGCPLLDIKPVHTSFTKDSAAVHDTVIEFLIMANASEVLSVTRSGFPRWAAAYGGVPTTEVWQLKI